MKRPNLSPLEWIMLILMNISIAVLAVIAIPSHGQTNDDSKLKQKIHVRHKTRIRNNVVANKSFSDK